MTLRMIAQIVFFSRKTDAQKKKNFAFRSAKIAQQFYEWKPYSESILKGSFAIISRDPLFVTSHKLLVPKYQGSLLRFVTLDGL